MECSALTQEGLKTIFEESAKRIISKKLGPNALKK
jgi:hypothetical protein